MSVSSAWDESLSGAGPGTGVGGVVGEGESVSSRLFDCLLRLFLFLLLLLPGVDGLSCGAARLADAAVCLRLSGGWPPSSSTSRCSVV